MDQVPSGIPIGRMIRARSISSSDWPESEVCARDNTYERTPYAGPLYSYLDPGSNVIGASSINDRKSSGSRLQNACRQPASGSSLP